MAKRQKKAQVPATERLADLLQRTEERIAAARAALAVINSSDNDLERYVGYSSGLETAIRDLSAIVRMAWLPAGCRQPDYYLPDECKTRPPTERVTQEQFDAHAIPELCRTFHKLPRPGTPTFRQMRDSGALDEAINVCAGMRAAHEQNIADAEELAQEIKDDFRVHAEISPYGELVIPPSVQPFDEAPSVGDMDGRQRVVRVAICGHDGREPLPDWVEALYEDHHRHMMFTTRTADGREIWTEDSHGLLLVVESEYVAPSPGERIAFDDVPFGHGYYRIGKKGPGRQIFVRGEAEERDGAIIVYAGDVPDNESKLPIESVAIPEGQFADGVPTVLHDGLPQLVLL